MKKKIITKVFGAIFFTALCMAYILNVSLCGASALNERKAILSIGDSISTGYGLEVPDEQGFVYNALGKNGIVTNMSVNGNTAEGILNQLKDKNHEKYISPEIIKRSDIVTVTCGGNDMMAVLYGKIAEKWNETHQGNEITGSQVPEELMEMDLGLLMTVVNLLTPESESYVINDASFEEALSNYAKNLKEITSYINSVNPSVAIIVATQYDPYAEFEGSKLDIVYKGIEDGVTKLNKVINENSFDGGYAVADAKKLFDEYDGVGDLYNADLESMNLDFHPSAMGHELLAASFEAAISSLEYVEITVSRYLESLEGEYTEDSKDDLKYEVVLGKKITAPVEDIEGFIFVEDAEGNVLSAVAAEGTVLKLYYSRNTYKVGWHTYENITFENYKYGEPLVAPEAKRKGYKFSSWDVEVPETMPAGDITFVAVWQKEKMNPVVYVIGALVLLSVTATVFAYKKDKKSREESKKE